MKAYTNNERRANNGRTTLRQDQYSDHRRTAGDWDYNSALRDTLTDMIHFIGPEEFDKAVVMSKMHHEAETKDGA